MKTWIILGLIMAMAAALFTAWQKHQRETPAYKKSLDQLLLHLYQSNPDSTFEQIANQVASEAARDQGVKFLVAEVIVLVLFIIIFAIFGARWWYLAAAFALWVVGIVGGVALNWL
jgi:hypothetical protein